MPTLHASKTVQSVQPKYVGLFSCTGPSCEDNCCTGWNVHIDKKTFNSYKQANVPELAERFEKTVKRTRSLNNDIQYARIEMLPITQECPFMQEKLCGIQSKLGEDKLSNTCSTYPRDNRVIGGQHEMTLTLSCPEAARLALLQADAMDFVEVSHRVRSEVIGVFKSKHGLSPEIVNGIRVLTLQLIRTDGLELWQKLAILGVFCEKLTQLLKVGAHTKIPHLIDETSHTVESGGALEALSELKADHTSQATIFASLWQIKLSKKHSPIQEQIHKIVRKGLGVDPETHTITAKKMINNYKLGAANLPIAMLEIPFILDNYVLNEMFREIFPFGEITPHDHFLKIITRLGLVRFMLAAQCTNMEELPSHVQMARTIQVFCRQYQHDVKFSQSVNNALRDLEWTSMEKIFKFLKT